jgi:DNA polymerase III delta prime subunit
LPVKVPYYLLFRHKSENNPYEDDPSGKSYHFPKSNPNATKVVSGAKSIWFDKIDKSYYFWGYGTVSKVKSRTEKDSDAIFDDFMFFEKQPDSLELNEKFLKKATPEIEEKIISSPRYNNQHSIHEISKEIFEDITGNKKIENNDQYDVGHKLFLIEMSQKEHKTPFIDFNHVDFVNEELNYKKVALEKSLTELSLDKWDGWISTPEKICQEVRNAVALKISKNLIWAPPFNTEIGYFDELDNTSKTEFGRSLYDLFKGSGLIEKRFYDFIISLEKIKRKPEMRLLAYLLFLYDSEKYFPIHPTNFDNLLEFYGFEKIRESSWKKYSQYLELASKLKSFLSQNFLGVELSYIQVQSYMWVIAGAISKNYWMIRPGTSGEDWENQRKTGFIGIHYYTLDLSEYAQHNNQLTKHKLQERMQELKQAQGMEPDSQPALDADFGQFEKIFAIRKKDKIIAIGNNSTLLGIGNTTDKYQFRTDVGENCHTIPVDWYDIESREIPKQEIRRTIKKLDIKDYVDIMSSQTITQKSNYLEFSNILNKKKQLIFYGPPGTGKTYTATNLAKEIIKNNSLKFTMTFRSAALKILHKENKPMHYEEIIKRAIEQNLIQTSGQTPEFTLLKEMSRDIQKNGDTSMFKKISKGTYSLNPEVEFTEEIKASEDNTPNFIRNVTFHQSYSYEEFIEGIKPNSVDGKVVYVIEPGIFRTICDEASADKNNKYVLIIDEINRGNISKIFGELITLIEKDKRNVHTLQLAYSKDTFTIPDNLYIIGTMNTADRSLIQIDAALRRRFAFCELMPNPELLTKSIQGISLKKLLEEINQRIVDAGLREKQIGHSYLMDVDNLDDLQFVFANEIIPLLQDYFFDDYEKLEEDILSSEFIDSENMIIRDEWKHDSTVFLNALKNTFQL